MGTLSPNPWDIYRGDLSGFKAKVNGVLKWKGDISTLPKRGHFYFAPTLILLFSIEKQPFHNIKPLFRLAQYPSHHTACKGWRWWW